MRPEDLEESFVALLNEHRGIIKNVCWLYGAGADRQDLFQDIVYQLWRSYPSFQGHSKGSTWVYRVALNTALSSLRKRYGRPDHAPLSDAAGVAARAEAGADERHAVVQDAIRELGAVERAIVMLWLDDLPYRNIAGILGISEVNVGVKLNRIKRKLQHRIGTPQCS